MQLHVGRALGLRGIHYFLCTTELLHTPVSTTFYSFPILTLVKSSDHLHRPQINSLLQPSNQGLGPCIEKMPARKRARNEAELDKPIAAAEKAKPHNETLVRLRNMWQFAALMQYMYIFGKPVKIDPDFDMEVCAQPPTIQDQLLIIYQDLEHECLRPEASEKLAEIALTLLKFVSSHRGLTYLHPPTDPKTPH